MPKGIMINLLRSRIDPLTPQQRKYVADIARDAFNTGQREGKTRAFWDIVRILETKEQEFIRATNKSTIPEETPTDTLIIKGPRTTPKGE